MKEMIKKIILPIILVLCITFSAILTPMIFASSEAKITASDVTANPGDTVDVDISFANNPGIMGATLTVTYDDKALTLTSVKDGGILGAQSHKPELKSPYTLAWSDDTAVTNNTANGVAATLTFKVSNSAVAGKSYPITLSYDYDNYDIYDVDLHSVKFTLVNGSVNIPGSGEQPTDVPSDQAQITVSDTAAKPGDTIDANITFVNNPGIMGATLTVTYDDKALTLVSVKDGGILGAQSHKPELKSPYTLAWSDDTAVTNNTANGVAATLTFKVSNNAAVGKSYPITLSYDFDNYDIYDVDLQPVKFTLVNGSVNVSENGEQPSKGQITASDVTAKLGDTVDVDIAFANNPGIMGATLTVTYDDKALTLVSVKDGGILGTQSHKPELRSPYTLAWSDDTALTNNTANGVAATLTFKVSNSAVAGKSYPIMVSYDYNNYDIYDVDLNSVNFTIVNGSVNVSSDAPIDFIRGDVNDDGKVDITDATLVQLNSAELMTLNDKQQLAADANCDGKVDVTDATYIQLFVAELIDHL